MGKLFNYLEENIELLWKNDKLRKKYLKFDKNERDIETILSQFKTEGQKKQFVLNLL